MLKTGIKFNAWIVAGVGTIAAAGVCHLFFSEQPSPVVRSVEASAQVTPPTLAPTISTPPGFDEAPDLTASRETSKAVTRILVPGICRYPNGKTTECTGANLRRGTNKSSTVDHFAPNGTQVLVKKTAGSLAQVEIVDDAGKRTGKIGWIESQYVVPGT